MLSVLCVKIHITESSIYWSYQTILKKIKFSYLSVWHYRLAFLGLLCCSQYYSTEMATVAGSLIFISCISLVPIRKNGTFTIFITKLVGPCEQAELLKLLYILEVHGNRKHLLYINYKIPEMLLNWYVCVNTCFPKAEYSASGCLSKEFGVAHWEMKNRTNSSSSKLAHEIAGKLL